MAWKTGNDKLGEAKIGKRIVLGAAAAIAVLLVVFHPWTPRTVADSGALRHAVAGDVIGFADTHDTYAWLGVPFAQPPVGALR